MVSGIKVVKNAIFTAVFVFVVGYMGVIRGSISIRRARRSMEFTNKVIYFYLELHQG